ncbi:cytochrome P450 [Frankia sp. CiP3]|uniref:cytochrome P450 n=1 Tax=Frankia sp. CiP3 TaxID=2880971 RepID=UPI001EF5B643|nr:cytochrome P450 [Frankia sp. CiP3]
MFGDRFERPGLFSSQDPPVHGFYRKQLTGQFTVKRMKRLEQRIEQIVADQLEYMASRGPVADLVADFALPVPSLVICELLGVDYSEHAFFEQQTATLLSVKTTPEQVIAAGDALAAFMLKLVRQKRNEPDDALLSGLIEAQREAERPLTDDELAGIAMMLLTAGHETTANMLGLGTLTLLHHPEQLAKLKADMSLVDTAVEELLRFNGIIRIGQVRLVTQDVQIGRRLIPAGSSVVASGMAANRDPEKFENPDELDITRGAVHHVAFGHGIHQCLGQQLARIELRVGYRRLFDRFPDLRLAIPLEDVTWRTDTAIYGVRELPVTW